MELGLHGLDSLFQHSDLFWARIFFDFELLDLCHELHVRCFEAGDLVVQELEHLELGCCALGRLGVLDERLDGTALALVWV